MATNMKSRKNKITVKKRRALLPLLLVAALILTAVIAGSRKSADKPALFSSGAEYVEGIDVSQHNGEIEWDRVAEGADFAVIRAGYRGYSSGEIAEDSRFKENIQAANKAEIPVGVYFYSQAVNKKEAREEAEFVLNLIKGCDVELPVFIDYEYSYNENGSHAGRLFEAELSAKEAADVINAFCERINKADKYAGVYSSSSVYNHDIKTSALKDNIYIWVADYNGSVSYKGSYDVWQYSKRGSCIGVNSKYVDVNRWYM